MAKCAVVVAGDPDPELRALATRYDALLRTQSDLLMPEDNEVVGALRGESIDPQSPGSAPRFQQARATLGWGEKSDAKALRSIAEALGTSSLLVVRRKRGLAEIVVFDATAAQFFEGEKGADEAAERALPWLMARISSASRRAAHREVQSPPSAAPRSTKASGQRVRQNPAKQKVREKEKGAALAQPPAKSTKEAPSGARGWMRANWAYFVAGALLVGAVSFFVLTRDRSDDSGPTLRVNAQDPSPEPALLRWH